MAGSEARLALLLREATALLRLADAAGEYRAAVRALDGDVLRYHAVDLDAFVGKALGAATAEIKRRRTESAYDLAIDTRAAPGHRPAAAQEAIHWANGWRFGPRWFVALEAYTYATTKRFKPTGATWWSDPTRAGKKWHAAHAAAGLIARRRSARPTKPRRI